METLFNLLVLSICIDIGIATIGAIWSGPATDSAVNELHYYNKTAGIQTQMLSQQGSVNPLGTFGAYDTFAQIFVNLFTGGHLVKLAQTIIPDIPQNFVVGIVVLNALYLVITLGTLISGRLFRGSP